MDDLGKRRSKHTRVQCIYCKIFEFDKEIDNRVYGSNMNFYFENDLKNHEQWYFAYSAPASFVWTRDSLRDCKKRGSRRYYLASDSS